MNAVLKPVEDQEPSLADSFAADIPLSFAVSAFNGCSQFPEQRGRRTRDDYGRVMEGIYNNLKAHATEGRTLDLFDAEFARLREGMKSHYLAWLSSTSECTSTHVTGAGNYNVDRHNKRWETERRRSDELTEFRRRAMRAAIRNLRPDLRPIMAGDDDAVERLEDEISAAEMAHERMKAANVAIRKHFKEGLQAQAVALVELGFTDDQLPEILTPRHWQGQGFASCSLTNNSANIRRMKQRLERLKRDKAKPTVSVEGTGGVSLEDCPPENRIRLRFPGKPPYKIRESIKPTFRWAPSITAWQAYRNDRSIELAQITCRAVACLPVSESGLSAWMQDNPTYALHATEDGYHWLVDESKVTL